MEVSKNIDRKDKENKEYPHLETPEARKECLQRALDYTKQLEENHQSIREEEPNRHFCEEEEKLKSKQENNEQYEENQRQQQQEIKTTLPLSSYIPVSVPTTSQNRHISKIRSH
ncbi:hypothetical protein Glove_504g3 [Diversispora epigaea]|uniref:Uncharacterized protein n=1 Tax=Diversispora epigaea TaxID=1348612 RepID=A0A397GGM7_9GLOM|nr:hypothetical protein Glove_504g3 [Diversispora epigaea]